MSQVYHIIYLLLSKTVVKSIYSTKISFAAVYVCTWFSSAVITTPCETLHQLSTIDVDTQDKVNKISDVEVYEVQLTQLQEQLITVMIENEHIS